MGALPIQLPSGIVEILVSISTVVFALMLIALVGFAYKSLSGDGITWPEDKTQTDGDDDVTTGSRDDEWEYY